MPNFKNTNNKNTRKGGGSLNSFSPEKLLPTEKIIRLAKIWGVDFGPGNPSERIRYFIKLGLLPHQVRKTPEGSRSDLVQGPTLKTKSALSDNRQSTIDNRQQAVPVGHLPYWTVSRLIQINDLYEKGLSYPQISQKIKKIESRKGTGEFATPSEISGKSQEIPSSLKKEEQKTSAPLLSFLTKSGLTKEEIENKLDSHKLDIEERLRRHKKEVEEIVESSKESPSFTESSDTISEKDILNINRYQNILKKDQSLLGPRFVKNQNESEKEAKVPETIQDSDGGSRFVFASSLFLTLLLIFSFLLNLPNITKGIKNYASTRSAAKTINQKALATSDSLGSVLAASNPNNRLYIDAITQVQGETTFLDPITAPNVIYSLTAGTGITLAGDQDVTISTNETLATVTARGSTTTTGITLGNVLNFGGLTSDPASATNGASYYNTGDNKFRCYVNGAWADCDTTGSGDITGVSTGNGLSGGSGSGDVTIDLDITTSGSTSTTSINSGLEVTSAGLSILRGCSNNQSLVWNSTTEVWTCGSPSGLTNVEESDVDVGNVDTLDFLGGDFDIAVIAAEANISLSPTLTSVIGVAGSFDVATSLTVGTADAVTITAAGEIQIPATQTLQIGSIELNDVGVSNLTSGAVLIGVFDEFTNSSATNLQDVLDDFDAAIGGGASKFTQDTGFIYLTNATDDFVLGGTTIAGASLYFDEDAANLYLGTEGSINGTLTLYSSGAVTDPTIATDASGNLLVTTPTNNFTTTTTGINSTAIGATTPSTGAFTTLNTTGTSTLGDGAGDTVTLTVLTTAGPVITNASGVLSSEAQLAISRGGTNSTDVPDAGAIAYGTGSAYAFSTVGTSGQAIVSGGTGAPTYTTGTLTLAGNFATSGANDLTLATSGSTTATIPSGTITLADLESTQTFSGAKTFNTTTTLTYAGTENLVITSDLAGDVDVISLTGTPSSSAGTTRGIALSQADSANSNGLDSALFINNEDTNLAITDAILITDTGGGGYTNILNTPSIDISGAGAITGATGITSSGTISFTGLSTDGVVYTSGGTGILNSEAQLAIARGGTNSTATPTAGTIAYGTGTAYAFSAAGTTGQCLISGGSGAPTWTSCDAAASTPFTTGGGIITKATAGDYLSLRFGDAGDTQLEIENTTTGTIPTVDAMQIDLTGGTTGIVTNGANGLYVAAEFGDGTGNTNSLLRLNLDPVNTPSGDENFYAINIDALTAGTAATEAAINIGANWDTFLNTPSLDISGAGAITGATGITSSGTITLSGLTASRTVFTDGSSQLTTSAASSVLANSITDEEGSGALVFGTSPTISGPTLSGTVNVSGLTASRFVTTDGSSNLATSGTSANLADSITNETGSGLVVFDTSPTLTTPTIAGSTLTGTHDLQGTLSDSTGNVTIGDSVDIAGSGTFTLGASDKVLIDGATTTNTGTAGILDINLSTNASQSGLDIAVTSVADAAGDTISGILVTGTVSTDTDNIYAVQVADLSGTATAGNEYAIYQAGTNWDYGIYVEDDSFIAAQADIRFGDSDNSNWVAIEAPATIATNFTLTLPTVVGSSGQCLKRTGGTGDLTWEDCLGGGGGGVTTVGSMTAATVFADSTADEDWLGLGASAGRIEFDDLATDEVNIVDAIVGIGTSTPNATLNIVPTTAAAFQIDQFGTSAGETGEIRLLEGGASSTQYTGFKAPDSLTTNKIYIFPQHDTSPPSTDMVLTYQTGDVLEWKTVAGVGGGGDITDVGSVTTGAAFNSTSADDQWLGLGASAGRIEFDDLATDEVNIIAANVGIGTSTPSTQLNITGNFDLEGYGSIGNGSAFDADETLIVNRAFTGTAANSLYQIHAGGNITEASSGTHATIAPLAIDAITVTDGGGSEIVTNLASLYIAGAPTAGTTPTNGPYAIFADAGNVRFDGQIIAGSTPTTITLSTGLIDADAIGLITGDGAGATSNGSGLETDTNRLGLLQGCADAEILKWVEATSLWGCSVDTGASSAVVTIQEDDSTVGTDTSTLDFQTDFDITEAPANENNIFIDYTNFGTRLTALNIADTTGTLTLDIGGVTNDSAHTINIATNGTTNADTITIGNSNTGTTLALTGGDDWSITTAGAATFGGALIANNSFTLGDNGETGSVNTSDWDISTTGDLTNIGSIGADGDVTITQATPSILLVDSDGASDDYSVNVDTNAFTIINDTDTRTELTFVGDGGIDLGDNTATKTIDIGGVTASAADTVNIATNGTAADVITIGNSNASTTLALTGGTGWSVTTAGAATFGSTLDVTGISTLVGNLNANGGLDVDDAFVVADGGALTTSATATFNALSTFNTDADFTLAGTENIAVTSDLAGTVNVLSLIGTPSGSAGTTRGLFVQQANHASNTNGLDTGILIDNADADLALTTAIQVTDSGGGGYTTILDTPSFDISGTGAVTGATGITSSGTISFTGLTTDGVVYTSGGTGTLNSEAQLALTRGGTNKNITASAGAVVYSDADSFELTAVGTTGQCLISNGTGAPSWTSCDSSATTPFTTSGGVIDKTTIGDRLRLQYGDAADTQLTIENTTTATIPTADAMQIDLTGGTTGIVTDGVDGLFIGAEFGNGTNNTNSLLHLDLDPVNTPTAGDIFYAINIDALTGTSAAERAIGIGSGWDTFLDTPSLDITGAGAITGATGITSSGTITFSGLTASRAIFTNGSSQLVASATSAVLANSITNETGSGLLVFGTAPTLSTLTVSSGGAAITGNSSVTGTLLATGNVSANGGMSVDGAFVVADGGALTTSQAATFNGAANFNGLSTFTTDVDFTLAGTENIALTSDLAGTVNLISLIGTPSSTAGTTRGLFIQQANHASNTNGLDTGFLIDNADADLALTTAIQITNTGGGGYTNLLDTASIDITGTGAITGAASFNGLVITPNNGTITTGIWNGSTIAVAFGGTGATTLTSNGVLYGNGTSPIGATAAGTNGQLLLGVTGSAPVFATMSADATITNAGVLTISADAVALGTDTTNNYVASITNGNGISGGDGGSESAALTLALTALSADWNQTGAFDIILNNADSQLQILESTGATFFGTIDVGDLDANKTYVFPNFTGSSTNICLETGNCAGVGGGITGSGTSGEVAIFTGTGTIASDSGLKFDTTNDILGVGLGAVALDTTAQLDFYGESEFLVLRPADITSDADTNNSPSLRFRGTYDSDPAVGPFTSSNFNFDIRNVMTAAGASPASRLDFINNGGSPLFSFLSSGFLGIGETAPTEYLGITTGTTTAIGLTRTSAGQWINFDDATDIWGLYNTAGSPEGVLTANTGALSMDTTNGTLYVKTDDGDNDGWINLATGSSSPFTASGGIIDKTDITERLRLQYGDAADTQLTIENTTNNVIPTVDAAVIDLTGNTTGIVTNNVDALYIAGEFGNGTSNTNSLLHLNLDPVDTPSGDENFYAINIDGLAAGTSATETAIIIGSNWDTDLAFADTSPTITIGDTGTLTITDGTNTLLSLADNANYGLLTTTGSLNVGTNEAVDGTITLFSSGAGETDPTIVAEADGDLTLSAGSGVVNIGSGTGDITIDPGANNFIVNLSSTGDFLVQDGGTTFVTYDDSGLTTFDGRTTTDTETSVAINANSLTTGKALNVASTSNAYTTGSILGTSLTQSAATGTSVSGDISSVAFSPTYSTAITTPTISGNVLDISRLSTTNGTFSSTLTVSGAVASISDNCIQTTGTCTSTANVLALTQSYASASGAVLNIANSGSGADIAFNTTPTLTIGNTGTLTITDGTNTLLTLADGGSTGNLTSTGTFAVNGNTTLGDSNTVDTLTGNLLTSSITSGATTQTALSLTAASLTTGEALDITATLSPTAGGTQRAIDINLTNAASSTANTFSGLDITTADATALTNTVYNQQNTLTLTGNAGKTGYGVESTVTSSSTTADTIYAGYFDTSITGALASGTRNTYGVYSAPANTATNVSGSTSNIYGAYNAPNYTASADVTGTTVNVYGDYISTTGSLNTGGTINQYGLYVADGTSSTTGTSAKYGIYVAPQTGADTNYGLCFDCDGTWSSSTVASGIRFGTDANAFSLYRSGNLTLATNATTLNFASATTQTVGAAFTVNSSSYVRIGDTASPGSATGDDDLFVEGDLEVDGVIYADNQIVQTFTGTTTDALGITASSLTTGSAIVGTGPTSTGVTDHFVKLTSDIGSASSLIYGAPDFSGAGVTAYGANITATDATTSANTDYAYYGSLALTGNAAKTGVGYYSDITTNSTTGDTLVAFDAFADVSTGGIIGGATTRNVYGLRSQPNVGAESTAGTTNVYGVYSKATGDVGVGGTVNNYGFYAANGTYDTDGTSTAIGLYLEPITGADTNVGICFDCDGTWSSSTVASGIQFGTDANSVNLYRSGNDILKTDDSLEVGGTLTAATGGGATFTVAASDSPARIKAQADYVADGTADQTEIQTAIDAIPSTGGTVVLAPGTFNLSAGVSITANERVKLSGYGATLNLAASTTAITVNQGISNAVGAIIEGIVIDGQSNASTKGILLEDTNNPAIYNVRIVNTAIGIHINSEASGEFVEGLAMEDVLIRDCVAGGTGIDLTTNLGTGSFAQHQWRHISVAFCDTGIDINNGAEVYRAYLQDITVFIGSNQTGVIVDGNVNLTGLELAVEGSGGSTGNTGLNIGSNATNTEHLDLVYSTWGTVNTQLSNSSSKPLRYQRNRNWFGSGSIEPLQIFTHGDTEERLGFQTGFGGGGGIVFGPGGGTAPDANLFRSAAATLRTDITFDIATKIILPSTLTSFDNTQEVIQSINTGDINAAARGNIKFYIDSNNNGSNAFQVFSDGSSNELFRIDDTGFVGITDTTPDYNLNISVPSGSDAKFGIDDGDVAHGLTAVAQTDTFFLVQSAGALTGGAIITGLNDDASTVALDLRGYIGVTDPTDSNPAVQIVGAKKNTTGVQDLAAAETVLYVRNNGNSPSLSILGNNNVGISDATPDALFDIDFSGTTTNGSGILATAVTSGNVFDLSNTSTVATSSDLIQGDHTATYTTTVSLTGSLLDLSRALTTDTGGALTTTGAVASITDNCTQTAGTCTNSANVLALTQSYASATGAVLSISNSGTGADIDFNSTSPTLTIGDTGTFTITDGTNTLLSLADNANYGLLTTTGSLNVGTNEAVNGTITLFSSGAGETDPTISAEADGDLTLSAGSGAINLAGSGSGSITIDPGANNFIANLSSTGDFLVQDGGTTYVTFDDSGLTTFDAPTTTDTETSVTINANSLTTGEALDITSTHAPTDGSTNEAIDINITHAPTSLADNFRSIELNTADATALANTVYGLHDTVTLTGNAAKTGIGYYGTVTSNSTTGDTLVVYDAATTVTGIIGGATTRDIFGLRSQPSVAAANTAGTTNIYGGYFNPSSTTATTGSTNNVYGAYITGTGTLTTDGTINEYRLYIADGTSAATGTSAKYGLYLEPQTTADTNYGICFDCDGTFGTQTVASGIAWGSDGTSANNIHLFRSANGTATLELGDGTDLIAAAAATFTINLDDTTSHSERLCHSGSDAATGVVAIADCSGTPGDYAEEYGTSDPSLEAGDIVITDPTRNAKEVIKDSQLGSKAWVLKSNSAYQPTSIGVVSTNPNEVIGRNFEESENPRPIALNGRVPVKVTSINGEIKPGDPITSSSIAGVGMKATKAGRTIGVALESFIPSPPSQSSQPSIGKILIFVNPTYYYGLNLASNGSLASRSDLSGGAQEGPTLEELSTLTTNLLNPDGTLNDQLNGQILTADQVHKLVQEEIARQFAASSRSDLGELDSGSSRSDLGELEGPTLETIINQQSSINNQTIDSPLPESTSAEATNSAALVEETQSTLDELNALLSTVDLELSTLRVSGNTYLAQTQVAGAFSQDGTFIIDYGRQINVLGTTLYLQNDAIAGDRDTGILVDIGSGKAIFDNLGNLNIEGTLIAANIQTKGITIDTSSEFAKTVGTATINSGNASVTIFTTAIGPEAKILVTPTTSIGANSLYVANKAEYEGFTVNLSDGAAAGPVTFDWLIVNTIQISEAN